MTKLVFQGLLSGLVIVLAHTVAHNFPGRSVGYAHPEQRRRGAEGRSTASTLRFVSNPHFRVVYPQSLDAEQAERVLNILESGRRELLHRVASCLGAGIQTRFPNLEIVINETTGDFVGRTRMPSWAAAATRNNTIEVQPLTLLKRRGILETTLRHELVHVLIDTIGGGGAPRWLTEGMALYVAGEGRLFEKQASSTSAKEIDQALSAAKSAKEMRAAYGAAYNIVKQLVRVEGENKVWKRLADRSYSVKGSD
jgi:hypothetical protein